MTGTTSEFGVQFDSLADIISFGMAPAVLTFAWGLQHARPARMGRRLPASSPAAALRLARFNIQTASADKRYFVGLPSPAAAGIAGLDGLCVSRKDSRSSGRRLPAIAARRRSRRC